MTKKNTDFSTSSFDYLAKELMKSLNEKFSEVSKQKDKALDECTDLLLSELEKNTPVGDSPTGEHLKDKWIAERKYKNVRYVNNTKLNEDGVPIINVMEYSQTKGKPFVRKTFDSCEKQFEEIFKKNLNEGD